MGARRAAIQAMRAVRRETGAGRGAEDRFPKREGTGVMMAVSFERAAREKRMAARLRQLARAGRGRMRLGSGSPGWMDSR